MDAGLHPALRSEVLLYCTVTQCNAMQDTIPRGVWPPRDAKAQTDAATGDVLGSTYFTAFSPGSRPRSICFVVWLARLSYLLKTGTFTLPNSSVCLYLAYATPPRVLRHRRGAYEQDARLG
jgi:hypothetical protein